MNDQERDDLLKEISKDVKEVKQTDIKICAVLFDTNGNPGVVSRVESNRKQILKLWIVVSLIVTSIGGGGFAIIRALLGN